MGLQLCVFVCQLLLIIWSLNVLISPISAGALRPLISGSVKGLALITQVKCIRDNIQMLSLHYYSFNNN